MNRPKEKIKLTKELTLSREEIIEDYRLAYRSRQASLVGRREVLSGKAKFGIFGDGKEVAQVALARAFRPGDWRSGYYRDQTLMLALGLTNFDEFFAQLYADADLSREPATAGRSMNAHFASRLLDEDGRWQDLMTQANTSADVSPTGSQMPRLVGLAYASCLYRGLPELQQFDHFSNNGNEVAFGTVGNATCAEGMFWESVNAIGVLNAPAVISIWDDGYGISVPNKYQITRENISQLLQGFQREPDSCTGYDLYVVRGWDYPALVQTYLKAAAIARQEHVPAIVHIVEVTQPQGHSTSGSHERYKSKERLAWEEEFDCLRKMRQWVIDQGVATAGELAGWETEDRQLIETVRERAWEAYKAPIRQEVADVADILDEIAGASAHAARLAAIKQRLLNQANPLRRDISVAVRDALLALKDERNPAAQLLVEWKSRFAAENHERYSSHLYSQSAESALNVPEIRPVYSATSPTVNGFELLNACFDAMLAREPRFVAFGEDLGRLGDVNQGFAGLQAKYGELRVADTGIRETTIIGQAIGLALRGLRPLAEIQYLDYLLYALQILSDDLATLHWRTRGGQKAPVIIRTRGHRLEGIWHSGSLMAGALHLLRGMHVLVPRNMTQATGFYNTLLLSDEPALVVEVLNGYRQKEKLPDNIGQFTVPVGVPEILRPGDDVTLVTYGAMCRIALEAADLLSRVGISVEVIDVQSLLPFDIPGHILESLKKTSRIVFTDEDVPGGTTAYMLQEVLEKQGGYGWLDAEPRTISGQPHRPAYGSDGDYWSKPNVEQLFETIYDIMNEADPARYPIFFNQSPNPKGGASLPSIPANKSV
ncbi:MAG: thiamine pyrophosphate-dependent enzyme [Chloroflexi bacterium]|nr:thiamine pyrophosphate-dependent enzyme [Chloroflexota bacterium]MCI0576421.1 thiamine pyrophosphate-dependent enzyme [Chloroflexota bacterium]MCI0643292.1 thiamine pyrophosphate-dependent enzyme [Chloroflexota bacterium]